ncbi:hypothetical protein IWX49DRAFT_338142 [Phyllosticta citricarpa]
MCSTLNLLPVKDAFLPVCLQKEQLKHSSKADHHSQQTYARAGAVGFNQNHNKNDNSKREGYSKELPTYYYTPQTTTTPPKLTNKPTMATRQSHSSLLHTHISSFLSTLTPPSPPPSPPALLSTYFTPTTPTIHEHGPAFTQRLLPFLGRPFSGRDRCLQYFDQMGAALELQIQRGSVSVAVDPDFVGGGGGGGGDDDVVDEEGKGGDGAWKKCPGRAVATGRCRCVCRATGRAWSEDVVWVFGGFESAGGEGEEEVRFKRWDIWADAASAWVAAGGGDAESVGWKEGEERDG